jgi:hypothetical protein
MHERDENPDLGIGFWLLLPNLLLYIIWHVYDQLLYPRFGSPEISESRMRPFGRYDTWFMVSVEADTVCGSWLRALCTP